MSSNGRDAACLPFLDGISSGSQLEYSQLNLRPQQGRKAEGVNIFYLPASHGLSLPFCEVEIVAVWQDDREERLHKHPVL